MQLRRFLPRVKLEAGARLLLAAELLLLAGCHDVRNERDQIYRAVLDDFFLAAGEVKPSIPLVSSQPQAPSGEEMRGLFEGYQCSSMSVSGPLKTSFSNANYSKPLPLHRPDLFRDVTLVPPDHYQDAAGHFSWDELFKHYGEKSGNSISLSSSLIIFSNVGFDHWGRRALVYVLRVGHDGTYFILEKKWQWRITDQCRVSVA